MVGQLERCFIFLLVITRALALYHTTFCMPTASRNVSYLEQVVLSYEKQGVFKMDSVGLLVLDADNSTRGRYAPIIDRKVAECSPTAKDVEGIPSCRVRQQALDVTASLLQCARMTSGWVVLVEDDCEACGGALDEVVRSLSGLQKDSIAMAKYSKFLRATAFPVEVVHKYVASVLKRLYTFPYDITDLEQWAPGRKQHLHSRNLFHHIGLVSTEPKRNEIGYRLRYAELRGDVCYQDLLW
jgi:hypothetical protein